MTLPGRYALDPLAHKLGVTLHHPGRRPGNQTSTNHATQPDGLHAIAHRVGVTLDHVRHTARTGLTDLQADRWAIACGYMPQQIWNGQWWANAPDEGDDWYADDPPLRNCRPRRPNDPT